MTTQALFSLRRLSSIIYAQRNGYGSIVLGDVPYPTQEIKTSGKVGVMKTFRIGVIFCLVMCVACGPRPQLGTNVDRLIEIPNSNSIDTSKETTLKGYEVGSSMNRLLLEVVSSRFGMVLTQGRVLDLRVLDNGDAEADHIDAGGHVLRKQYTLNSDEMKTLQRMLTLPGVREAGPKYALEDACLDASYEREFILSIPDVPGRKSIVILECRPAKSDQTLKLPPEDVTMLLNFVDDLRSHKPSASDAIDNGLVLDAIDQFAALGFGGKVSGQKEFHLTLLNSGSGSALALTSHGDCY